jgi:hypothetical protein
MRVRSALLAAICASSVAVSVSVATVATAAGTGEFCGPGWQKVTTPAVQRYSSLADLDGASNDLWAVGAHHREHGRDASLAVHWDGGGWTEVATVDPGSATRLEGVAWIGPGDVWAVGSTDLTGSRLLAEHWNGATWKSFPTPDVAGSGDELWSVDAVSSNDVWAVGTRGGATTSTVTVHWNGATWSSVPSPSPGSTLNSLYGVEAVSATEAWAFGVTGDSFSDVAPLVLRWNGATWSAVAEAGDLAGMFLSDGSVAGDGDVWTAGGAWNLSGGLTGISQHRQGSSWTTWPASGMRWASVDAIGDTDAWLAGATQTGASTAHWDGAGWTVLHTPPGRATNASPGLEAVRAVAPDEIWAVGAVTVGGGITVPGSTTLAMRLCPLDVTDAAIQKPSSRVSQGSGTLWRFPSSNHSAHDVTESLGLGGGGAPLFGTGSRAPGTTGTFELDYAGTFAVEDTTTGHPSELTVPTEALPKKAALGTTFTISTSALASLPSPLGTDIRYRKPGSEFWYRLVSGTTNGETSFTPAQTGVFTIQARLKNKATGIASEWSPFAMINVTAP